MKHLIACLVIVVLSVICCAVCADETPAVPEELQQEIHLDDMTLSLTLSWIPKELSEEDTANGIQFWAETSENTKSLMLNFSGNGDSASVMELATVNDYAGIATRVNTESYNGIDFVLAVNEENHSVYAYFSISDSIYTISFLTHEDIDLEEMQNELLQICSTITPN